VVYLESGYVQLLWIGGIPLLLAVLWLVRHVWRVGDELSASANAWGACGRACQVGWAMVAVLSVLDPHLTLRGTGDLLFVLLAITIRGVRHADQASTAGVHPTEPSGVPVA
jgi:hypothetical protein